MSRKSVETLEIRLRRVFLTFAVDFLSILQSKTCLQRYAVATSIVCLIMTLFSRYQESGLKNKKGSVRTPNKPLLLLTLFTNTKFLDNRPVAFDIFVGKIVEQMAAFAYHFHETTQ